MVGQTLLLNNPFKFQEEQKARLPLRKNVVQERLEKRKKDTENNFIELLLKCLNHEIITMIFIE